jgi:hypothetical protein
VALAWQVISLGSPAQLSLVTVLYAVGLLAFVLVGGVAADRSPQRFLKLAADLVRAVLLLLLGRYRCRETSRSGTSRWADS